MDSMGVDFAVLQETKITGGIYTRRTSGYDVVATDAKGTTSGGVALIWREGHDLFEVEEVRVRSANVVSCELVTAAARWFVVGYYNPPSDLDTLT